MDIPTATRTPSTVSDPDLPDEVDFSRGRRGGLLPADPTERARVLEKRVVALQQFGLRLREAAERVAESARQEGDTYVVPEQVMRTLFQVLGVGNEEPDCQASADAGHERHNQAAAPMSAARG